MSGWGHLKTGLGVLLLASLWGAGQPVHAQSAEEALLLSQRAPGTGARGMALGGAGIGGLADYSAFYTNPAGLGWMQSSVFAGTFSAAVAVNEAFLETGAFTEETSTAYNIGNLAYLYKFPTTRGSLVAGVALNQVRTFENTLGFQGINDFNTITTSFLPFEGEFFGFDENGNPILASLPALGFEAGAIEVFAVEGDPDAAEFEAAAIPGTTLEQSGTFSTEGSLREVSFGGAIEASKGLMVGLSANVVFGEYRFNNRFVEFDVNDENGPDDFNVALEFDEDGNPTELFSGFRALEWEERLETTLTGFNVRGGLSGALVPGVRFGVVVESPTFYDVTDEFDELLLTEFDGVVDASGQFTGRPAGQAPFLENDLLASQSTFEYQIRTPWRFGAGVTVEVPALTLTADAEFVDWTQLELGADVPRDVFDADAINRQIEDELFEPVINLRGGAEFNLGPLALRGGAAYQPDPRSDDLPALNGGDLNRDRMTISAGVGLRFGQQAQLNLAWAREMTENGRQLYPEDQLGPRDNALFVDEDLIRDRFRVGISVFF